MKNILLWVGIAALALQDYFKKQPVKTTRQQQFLQTGETSQAFIAGNKSVFTTAKKVLIKYIGSPRIIKKTYVEWVIKNGDHKIIIWMYIGSLNWNTINIYTFLDGVLERENAFYLENRRIQDFDSFFEKVLAEIFNSFFMMTNNEDYKKLLDITKAGDWELALEIAKGQNLL